MNEAPSSNNVQLLPAIASRAAFAYLLDRMIMSALSLARCDMYLLLPINVARIYASASYHTSASTVQSFCFFSLAVYRNVVVYSVSFRAGLPRS